MLFFALFAPLVLLAGRALAQNVQVALGNNTLKVSDMIFVPEGELKTACQGMCDPPTTALKTCGDANNIACVCTNETMGLVHDCQQCMLTELIRVNKPMPDPRAGSTPLLSGLSGFCGNNNVLNITVPAPALTLPVDWDGPQTLILSDSARVFAVGFGGILGVGALYILSNI